jgi:hypothetical protein
MAAAITGSEAATNPSPKVDTAEAPATDVFIKFLLSCDVLLAIYLSPTFFK